MRFTFDFGQLNLVKIADRSDHFVKGHGARTVLVNFPKPSLELVTVKIGVDCVHFGAECLQPQLGLEHVQVSVGVEIKAIENLAS